MKLFGRRGPAPPPPAGDPADVDMAKRLEDVTARPARPARPASRAPDAGLRKGSRTSDYVGRVATHRFAVILTETDEIAAINYVERVREAWESLPALAAGTVRVGFGWAGTPGRATLLDARPTAEDVLRDDLRARPG
jgi:hypothetical protein